MDMTTNKTPPEVEPGDHVMFMSMRNPSKPEMHTGRIIRREG